MVKFIIRSDDNFLVNHYLLLICNEYNENGKVGVNKYMQSDILNNLLIDEIDKKNITSLVKYNLTIINFLNLAQKKNNLHKKDPINNATLTLESITSITCDYLDLFVGNKYYRLTVSELRNLIDTALLNQCEGYPHPIYPKNPYTGQIFKYNELINIYNSMIESKKVKINKPFKFFYECNFKIKKFKNIYYSFLCHKACENFIYDLSDSSWKECLIEYLEDSELKKYTCTKCLLELKNIKEIFTPVLITYQKENNNLYVETNSYDVGYKLIKMYNLNIDKKHYLIHRKYKKISKKHNKTSFFDNNDRLEIYKMLYGNNESFGNCQNKTFPWIENDQISSKTITIYDKPPEIHDNNIDFGITNGSFNIDENIKFSIGVVPKNLDKTKRRRRRRSINNNISPETKNICVNNSAETAIDFDPFGDALNLFEDEDFFEWLKWKPME